MTANQISWWNIQESIRSHMQNELNERNKNSITNSLGDEQNSISRNRMENDFVLGQQGNQINQQQADTAARRTTQDYDIGLKNVSNVSTANANQATRNRQEYELGTIANKIKATDVANNFIVGQGGVKNQSIRNAQDFAIGNMQQATNVRLANAAELNAGAQLGKLNPAGVIVALTAPYAQKATAAGAQKIVETAKKISARAKSGQPVTTRASMSGMPTPAKSVRTSTNPRKAPLRGHPH